MSERQLIGDIHPCSIKNTVKPALKTTCKYKGHLLIKTTLYGPHGYTFNISEPAYKDRLCIRIIFCWSLGWFLYTSFTVHVF